MKRKIIVKPYKQYKYLYKKILDKELIKRAFYKMKKGKRKRKKIIQIENNLDYYTDLMYVMLLNTRPGAEHPELGFKPREHKPTVITEHGKERKIYVPDIIEQWVHHIIMQVLAPILLKIFHHDSYGSVPNKGLHRGKKAVIKYRHRYKYVFKLDIRHFFASVRLEILEDKLCTIIADDWFVDLIMLCFKWFNKGLPLGYYLSQWLSNFYLNDIDWFISSCRLNHVRYVDDIVIFGNNKRKIRKCFGELVQLLGQTLRLKVKNNYQLYRNRTDALSFLGFVVTDQQIRIRKNIARGITKVAKRIHRAKENNRPVWIKDAHALLSYMGWIKHSDSYVFYWLNVKPNVVIKKLKQIVSKNERRKRDDEMGNRSFRPQPACA